MKLTPLASAALLGLAFTGAQATVTPSTSGLVTTYTENFNGGSSFSGGWFNAPLSPDDYLWLSNGATSSYTFSSAVGLASLTLDFWYSSNANTGTAALGPSVDLLGSTGLLAALNNPGADSSTSLLTLAANADAHKILSFTNLAAGNYTLTFKAPTGLLSLLKVDDVTITTTAVPEPGSPAMLFAGLGALAFIGRRRKLYG